MNTFKETKLLEEVVCQDCGLTFNIKDCFISGTIIPKDKVVCVFIKCPNCAHVLGNSWIKIAEYKGSKPILKGEK